MKTTKIIPTALLMTTIAMSGSALAHDNDSNNNYNRNHNSNTNIHFDSENNCSIDLHNGVTVTPKFVKVFDKSKTLYRIEQNGAMTVNGDAVELTASQQQISADYANGIRKAVPEAVEIAVEAMDMASTAVTTAFAALFGENSDIEYKISQVIEKAKDQINENINQSGEEYTIAPDSFDNIEDAFDDDFKREIEKVAMGSMGSIFSLMGDAMSNGSGDFEQRMEAFGEKMENMGDNLERSLEAKSEKIEAQAEALCDDLKEIDKLETQLQQQIPQFAKYELLDMEEKRSHRNRRHHNDENDNTDD